MGGRWRTVAKHTVLTQRERTAQVCGERQCEHDTGTIDANKRPSMGLQNGVIVWTTQPSFIALVVDLLR